ncbi:threonine--tRNA ligase [Candidatus Woesearchaeota archaeon]|nr:threonine--tRNA ligase [Candidatus Woesearchaeota archaeon]
MIHIKITLPDGSVRDFPKGTSAAEIAKSIGRRLAEDAVAAKINGTLKDLDIPINEDAALQIITLNDEEGLEALRHSAAHLLAAAVMEIWPDAKRTIGPAIENGFYYDFEFSKPISEEDLGKIERKMRQILPEWDGFERHELSAAEAKKEYPDNPFKHELIDEFSKGNRKVSFYKSGNYWDLCRGGHVPSMKIVKPESFKLTKIARAYWRGNEKNPQLTRIYGLAFPTKKELDEYLKQQEEAEKRDHRKLGKQLDLFSIHEEGPGFVFFHPKGMLIVNELMDFSRKLHEKNGYKEIKTPIILNKKLWEQSGHWEHYKDAMYFTRIEEQDFAVKPMNCPGSILVYKEAFHSYKEFPLRLAEYGLVHRHELSGVLSGLFRVRSFTQDDAHIYSMPSQIKEEVMRVIELADYVYKIFGFEYHVELSTKPEKAMGSDEIWEVAEQSLKDALTSKNINFKINQGAGAFYGPKIDFHIKDVLGRSWQCATIQVDFQMPEKFDLHYVGEDNSKHRPVIIHRVIYGSIERFFGILIEHFAGKFPLWLAPLQARILTVADRFEKYANIIKEEFEKNNIRIEVDARTESVGYKVREAQLQKIPLILTVGEKEEKNKAVAVRTLDNKVYFDVKVKDLMEKVLKNVEEKKIKVEL